METEHTMANRLEELRALCLANDYDAKFDQIANQVAAHGISASVRALRAEEIPASMGGASVPPRERG